jgi:TonB-linked SusC/RagA family outer membrane protein
MRFLCSNWSMFKKLWAAKTFRSMRLTFYAVLLAVIQAYALSGYAQVTKLNLIMKNATVREVLLEIENMSKFRFLYNSKMVNVTRKVDVKFKDFTIDEAMNELFKDEGVEYTIIDRQVVLSAKGFPVYRSGFVQQQQRTVSGKVTDASGEPLPGVSIVIEGTTQGTVTNADGEYTLTNLSPDATLVFSFVGMRTQEIVVGNQTTINVTMEEEVIGMEEVVVIGYGTQRKINLTGSVDMVTDEQITQRPVTNVSEALQGVSPNLNISPGEFSAEPGGEMSMNIRGIGSLTGDYSPYILVDGVPMDINLLNPNDIESISVLKDAAASAIYGARAPYGVILITTKKGEMNEEINITYSNNTSFSSPMGRPHMHNSLEYMTAHDQSSVNAGLEPNFSEYNYERVRQYMAGEIEEETWALEDSSDWHGNDIWDVSGNANNDWMYIYYKDLVMRQKHDINISGGGKNNSFYVSAGYWDQPGELRYGDQYYKRYNITGNLISKPTDWLTVNFNSKYINDETQYYNAGLYGSNRGVQYHNFFRTIPVRPLYLPDGNYSWISYILPMIDEKGKNRHYGSQYMLTLSTVLEPIKNWKTTISYNYKNDNSRIDNYHPTIYGENPKGEKVVYESAISDFQTTLSETGYSLFNIISSYNITLNNHYLYLLGGFEGEQNKYNSLWSQKQEVLIYGVPSISTSVGEYYTDDSKSHWATAGLFGRFQYNYNEKYLFEANMRYDGSSRFEESTRWGFFPSFSLGYNISRESFWESIEPYITTFKIRVSWGSLGNQNVPNYLYLPNLGIGTNLGWIMGNERPTYTTAPDIVSAELTWETSTTKNIGFDASFLEGKINTSIDIYSRLTTNMFGPSEALPSLLGTSPPRSNNATLKTNGFEIVIDWKDKIGSDLSYNIKATLSDNVSTVEKYNNPTKTLSTWYEGQTLGEIWGLRTAGIYQSDSEAENGPDQSLFYPRWGAGDIHYKDIDGDNEITRGDWTADDSGDYSVIGNENPRFLSGLTLGIKWKGFDFNMFWQGVLKRDYAFDGNYDMTFFGFSGHAWWNMNTWYKGDDSTLDYWRSEDEANMLGPNTDAYYPKPYLSKEDMKNKEIQTRYMQSGAYFRLKNLTLGYTIPSNILMKTPVKNARIFVTGENLITMTSLTKLIDPEVFRTGWGGHSGKLHFLRKVYAIGLNVTF